MSYSNHSGCNKQQQQQIELSNYQKKYLFVFICRSKRNHKIRIKKARDWRGKTKTSHRLNAKYLSVEYCVFRKVE